MRRHTFSAFWLRSSVVSVLISLISGTCYMVTNEINCIVWATSMDQAPGLLALQDRGPGFALLPGAARRSAPPLTKKKRKFPKKKESSQKRKVHAPVILLFPWPLCVSLNKDTILSHWNAVLPIPIGVLVPLCLNIEIENRGRHSQPVLKKLVCDNSTPFHEWCG